MVTYVRGDATKPQGDGPKIIAHICNDEGLWGAGFVPALNKLSPEPKRIYRKWYSYWTEENHFLFMPLGLNQTAIVNEDLIVTNMTAQHRTIRSVEKPICYKALERCLESLAEEANFIGASVHMPRIGVGLAGGDWNFIESIINTTLTLRNISVTVYDL